RPRPLKVLSGRHDFLLLLAESLNTEAHDVARFQELRLRLHAQCDAGRSAGGDDVAGLHDEELRAVPDQVFDAEDHGLGRAFLTRLAVAREPHVERLRIRDLVLGDEPRPDRPEGLTPLAFVPLATGARDLEITFRYVIGEEIAGDRLHRLALLEIAC